MTNPFHDPTYGQRAPQFSDGHGVTMLFWCPGHHRPWLRDGTQPTLVFAPGELGALAAHLHADLDALPPAHCPPCMREALGGELSLDEYQHGSAFGYGLSWEGDEPAGTHLLALTLALPVALAQPHAQLCTQPERARHWLAWLEQVPAPQSHAQHLVPITPEMGLNLLAVPPGHGAPGTTDFVWRGLAWNMSCRPLGGLVQMLVVQAMPPREPFTLALSLELLKTVASLGLRLDLR